MEQSMNLEFIKYNEIAKYLTGFARCITYEVTAKQNGVFTPLKDPFENLIVKMTEGSVSNGNLNGFNRVISI